MAGFDFFRSSRRGYEPRTPAGALKAIGTGTLPVEHFIYASTSAKPLDEEPFDLDGIERVLARRDLTLETNLLLKGVFEKLINSSEQETALFGAEGINALEARHVNRIEELKAAIEKGSAAHPPVETLRALARQYYELAELHGGSGSIRLFYLREAFSTLRRAHRGGRISRSTLVLMVDILVALGLHGQAALLLGRVRAAEDHLVLLLAARVAFHRGEYSRVADCCRRLSAAAGALGERERAIVEFWAGGGARA